MRLIGLASTRNEGDPYDLPYLRITFADRRSSVRDLYYIRIVLRDILLILDRSEGYIADRSEGYMLIGVRCICW